MAVDILKAELFGWYARARRRDPPLEISQLSNLTLKMLGALDAPMLRTKAMETLGLAMFLVETLPTFLNRLPPHAVVMLEAGRLLLQFRALLLDLPPDWGAAGAQTALHLWKRFMKVSEPLQIHVPKTHLMLHCLLRSEELGNPVLYQTFADEGLNSTLRKVLRLCHQSRFEHVALIKLNSLLQRLPRKRAR